MGGGLPPRPRGPPASLTAAPASASNPAPRPFPSLRPAPPRRSANNTWTITTASTSAADCAYVKPGFYNRTSDNHIVPCPVNTYFSGDPPKKKTNQTACTNW